MPDNLTQAQRHKNMKNIRYKDTSIELKVRKALYHAGFRYLKNVSSMIGKPDIVLTKYNVVIFISGCFWHRHANCKYASIPKTRYEYWQKKFYKTVERDKIEQEQLMQAGWKVIVVWECQIKKNFDICMQMLIKKIQGT